MSQNDKKESGSVTPSPSNIPNPKPPPSPVVQIPPDLMDKVAERDKVSITSNRTEITYPQSK